MKRLSLYLFLIFFTLQTPSQADVLVIVKNKIDENIFIKRTKATKEEAVEAAMKGCTVLFKYNEDMNKEKRQKMMDACYVFSVVDL